METTMRTRIIRIGNSQGIRIPKPLLEDSGIGEEVELKVEDNRIIISDARKPRQGWEEAFRLMAERGDDKMLDDDSFHHSSWDEEEWEW
jgi:antitoxin MazE